MATAISILLGCSLGLMLAIVLLNVWEKSHLDDDASKFVDWLDHHV